MSRWDARGLVLGHRGVRPVPRDPRRDLPIENTLAAFERALDDGADGIELDARLTRDGVPVVLHDPDLARTFGLSRALAELRASELPRALPKLADALDLCAARGACVNVEIKYDVPDQRALAWACAEAIGRSRADALVSSFDPRALAWLAARAPSLRRAWLVNATQWRIEELIALLARRTAFYAVHLEKRLATNERVRELHQRGMRAAVWTLDDPREAARFFALGVDWVITDIPAGSLARDEIRSEPG